MQILGIITEYNPLHLGHTHLMAQMHQQFPQLPIVCVMSGNFVQRGDFAIAPKHVRAKAAVESGADLVLELPLPWAISSAEGFAQGAVDTLLSTGLLSHLAFGSEAGDGATLQAIASAIDHPDFSIHLKQALSSGVSFAKARQIAVGHLLGDDLAKVMETPNNALGIEYCRALQRRNAQVEVVTIPRMGAQHDGAGVGSASHVRTVLKQGGNVSPLLPPAMAQGLAEEIAQGRAPIFGDVCQRSILAKLRTMTLDDVQALDGGNEGLYHRFYKAAQTAPTLEDLLSQVKTKRYAYARLRRMTLWAYLGLTPDDVPATPLYVRVLAANQRGRETLSIMRKTASVPIITKPGDVRRLSPQAQALFAWEVRGTDLHALAYPDLRQGKGGLEWVTSPIMVD